jgi:ribosomal protein L29
MKVWTDQLEDTSLINKTKRDVARVETILRSRELGKSKGEKS